MAKTRSTLNLSDVVVLDVKVITRNKIGSGTFVRVYKAQHNKKIFAAKEFHCLDTTVSRDGGFDSKGKPRTHNATELLKECQRCMKLDHANVVRLLGLHYRASSAVPILIVEKLRETLKYFLENNEDVEAACKLSILLDVAKGLMYLHSRDPQIACGCLTSKDILLTDQRRAKIPGDSRVTNWLKQANMGRLQSDLKKERADFLPYGVKLDTCNPVDLSLDVFCYGGVMLHVLTQTWPKLESTRRDKSISEIDRRSKYIEDVSDHRFRELIKCCLDDNPRGRLKIVQVHAALQNIAHEETSNPSTAEPDHLSTKASKMMRQESQNNEVDSEKIIKQKDENMIKQTELLIQQKDEEVRQIIEQKDQEMIKQKKLLIQQKDEEIHKIIQQKEVEIEEVKKTKDEEIKQLNMRLQEVKDQLKEISNKQERKAEADKEMQINEKSQQHSQGRSIKNQQADVQQRNKVLLPDAEMCEIHLTEHVAANKTVLIIINLKSSQGQPITKSSGSISIKIMNTVTKQTTTLPILCNEKDNGQYVLSYSIAEIGVYKLQVCFNGQKIFDNLFRIQCLRSLQQDADSKAGMRIIKPLQNATATSCYFNSVLQVLNQTTGFVKMMLKYGEKEKRSYAVSYKNDNVEMEISIDLFGVGEHTLLYTLSIFLQEVVSDENVVVQPDRVLLRLTENSSFKHQRQGQNSQEDSHELLRYLLYELKKEEVDLIKKDALGTLGYSSNLQLDESDKKALKNLLRDASKKITPIEEVFGGMKLNTVICRDCKTPLQSYEPFFDISLGLPDLKQQRGGYNYLENYRQNNQSNATPLWQQQQTRGYHVQQRVHSSYAANTSWSPTDRHATSKAQYGEYNKKSVQALLMSKENFFYQSDKTVLDPNGVEAALADHTDIDNMDENNKFICKACTEKKGTTATAGDDGPCLCLVTKQILIHQIPKVLILHFKRFNLDTYMVTKETKHVAFSPILNMAPYCSNKCIEDFGDKKGDILYGLYGVVEHIGHTLQSGHYIAYVRKRPERQHESNPANNSSWEYSRNAAHDGKWFYTSDLTVWECTRGFEDVKNCNAYMLFYELLPKNVPGSLVYS